MNAQARLSRTAALLLALSTGVAAAAAPAQAAKPASAPTGTWAGTATYVSPEDFGAPGIEYRSSIVITAERSGGAVRVTSVYATVRTYCLDSIQDIRLTESRRGAKGPKVSRNGDFAFSARGATIRGRLSNRGSGTIMASVGGCDLKDGSWKADKRRF